MQERDKTLPREGNGPLRDRLDPPFQRLEIERSRCSGSVETAHLIKVMEILEKKGILSRKPPIIQTIDLHRLPKPSTSALNDEFGKPIRAFQTIRLLS